MTAKRKPTAKPTAKNVIPLRPSEPKTALEVINHLTTGSNVPMARLQAMLEMQERLEQKQAERAYAQAMSIAQARMRGVMADSVNEHVKRGGKATKYASYQALDAVIRPIYTELGFSLEYGTAEAPTPDTVRVTLDVSLGDFKKHFFVDMPIVTKGPQGGDVMTKTHATMSALTYGRRALATMAFNLVTRDDDGNAAGGVTQGSDEPLNEQQRDDLMTLIVQVGADIAKVCAKMGVENINEIPQSKFADLMMRLKEWGRMNKRS